ncbi:MAG: hypothetical protein HJJLKODD_01913 [Phycisphaerae bacterium]|nr:hypothetical protein [Phycisphaerae bacterium]
MAGTNYPLVREPGTGGLCSPPPHDSPNGDGEHISRPELEIANIPRLPTGTPPLSPEVEAAKRFLSSPRLFDELVKDVQALGVVGEQDIIVLAYLTATGRLMDQALHLCVNGGYSSGKTFVTEQVLKLFPPDDVFKATQLTPKHLFNLSDDEAKRYQHKIIFIKEMTSSEGDLGFREMAESGEVKSLSVRDGKSIEAHAYGPVTFIATTTLPPELIKGEDASRWIFIDTDSSEQQTESIMQDVATRAADPDAFVNTHTIDTIIQKHHAAQIALSHQSGVKVVIPFASLIRLPAGEPRSRRLQKQILRLVEVIAYLWQFREGRRTRTQETGLTLIDADAEDWQIALPLVQRIYMQKLEANSLLQNFISQIQKDGRESYTMQELVDLTDISDTTVSRRIQSLSPGMVTTQNDGKTPRYQFHLEAGVEISQQLPTVEDIRVYLHTRGEVGNEG